MPNQRKTNSLHRLLARLRGVWNPDAHVPAAIHRDWNSATSRDVQLELDFGGGRNGMRTSDLESPMVR